MPQLGLASEFVRLGLVSVSSSDVEGPWSRSRLLNCQRLGLGLGLGLQGLVLASVSNKKASCTSRADL